MQKLIHITLSVLIFVSSAFICANPAQTKLAATAPEQSAQKKLAAADQQTSGDSIEVSIRKIDASMRELEIILRKSEKDAKSTEESITKSVDSLILEVKTARGILAGSLLGTMAGLCIIAHPRGQKENHALVMLIANLAGMVSGGIYAFITS